MSRATLYVKFPDGSLRYGLYCGTSDIAWAPLYDTPREAWDAYVPDSAHRMAEDLPVRIATDYGGGFAWSGRATAERLTEGFNPDESSQYTDGLPSWATYPGPVGGQQ